MTIAEMDDGNPCTIDSCDPAAGIIHVTAPAGSSCSDGNVCNGAEVCNVIGQCQPGTSLAVDDGNPCTTDSCDPILGVQHWAAVGQPCSDGNACTTGDTCTSAATCVGTPITAAQLDDQNSCTVDSCDPVLGITHTAGPGGLCSDGNLCNGLEACNGSGQCIAGTPPLVDDGDPCTDDSCDPVLGVRHTQVASCGPPAAGAMAAVAGNPFAQEIPQAPSRGGPVVIEHLGQLAYQYGFELTAARGRYQPRLELTYSSNSTEDQGFGVGWSISMSYIETDIYGVPRASDGIQPERYWLSMDGARKLLVRQSSGKFQPEVVSSWIELTAATDKWTAVDAMGNSYEFAQFYAGPSGKGGRWYLTKVNDVDGNQTVLTYLRDGIGAAAQIQSVKYNIYSGGTQFATQVLLTYVTRSPTRLIPVAGTISNRSLYLDRVLVQNLNVNTWATVQGYAVSYEIMREGVTVLTSIARFGTDPSLMLPATAFTYAVPVSSGYELKDGESFTDPAAGVTSRAWVDVDGDSLPDRVWMTSTSSGFWWARNTTPPGSNVPRFDGAPALIPGSEGAPWIETYPRPSDAMPHTTSALRDVDGDGVADLLTAGSDYSAYYLIVKFGQIVSGSPFFGPAVQIRLPDSLRTAYMAGGWGGSFALDVSAYGRFVFRLVDVNGDGTLDFAFTGGRAYLGYFGSNGTLAFSNEVNVSGNAFVGLDDDINGDGFFDRISTYNDASLGEGRSLSSQFTGFSWFRADGSLTVPAEWYVCNGTQPPQSACDSLSYFPDPRQRKALADLDGDGRLDTLYKTVPNEILIGDGGPLCLAEPCPIAMYWGSPSGHVARSILQMPHEVSGGPLADLFPAADPPPWDVECGCFDIYDDSFTGTVKGQRLVSGWEEEFIDLNGDGVLDHVVVAGNSARFYEGDNGTNGRPAVLQSVVTSAGARYDVTYAPATHFGANFHDTSPSVVMSITISQPDNVNGQVVPFVAENTTHYWYAAGAGAALWFDPNRREPRGFAQTWAQEETGRVVRSTTWATSSHALGGSPLVVEWGTPRPGEMLQSGAPASDVFRRATYEYQVRKIGSSTCYEQASEPPASAYSAIPVTTSFRLTHIVGSAALTSERTTLCTDVDDYGNTLRVKSDPDITNPGDEYYEQARFDMYAVCKSCVVETKKSSDFDGTQWLQRSVYRYDSPAGTANSPLPEMSAGNGHLNYVSRWVKDSRNPGSYEIESFTAYTGNGSIASRTEGTVTEGFEYDAQALRLVKATRTDGATTLESVSAYDPATGWIIREEGPYLSGSSASRPVKAYAYDAFGRVIAAGRSVSNGLVTGALSATEYVDSAPPVVKSYVFAAPLTITAGASIPVRPDVKQTISYMDGLGRVVQIRERLGVTGSTDPAVSGIGTQIGSGYRVTKNVQLDGAGRAVGTLEAYLSDSAGYEPFGSTSGGGRRGALIRFDARGWVTCTATGVYASLAGDGACTSSFSDDAGYRLSTAYRYRGIYSSPRYFVGVEVIPPSTGPIAGNETQYGPAGRAESSTDAYGNAFYYGYDVLGQRTSIIRLASGAVAAQPTTFEYDTVGRLVSDFDPNWSASSPSRLYSYDPQGRVTRVLLPNKEVAPGQSVRPEILYEYESLGRQTRVYAREPTYVAGSGVTMVERTISTTTYDRPYLQGYEYTAGQVASIASPNTTLAFGYDANGVPVRRDQWFVGMTGAFTSTAVTSNDGRVLSTTFSSPFSKPVTTTYRYDTMLRPTTIDVGATRAWEVTSYDALDRAGDVRSNGGTVVTHREYGTYDGQLKLQTVGATAGQVYGVDNLLYLGGKLKAARDPNTATDYSYDYDANGRLLRAAAIPSATGSLAQTFDERYAFSAPSWPANASMGNLERVSRYGADGSVVVKANDYALDRLTASWVGGTAVATYSYDESGRMVQMADEAGSRSLEYDVEGHLTAVTPASGLGEVLAYDPTGQLMFRKVGTKVTYYVGALATVTGDVPAECGGYGCTVVNVKIGAHVLLGGTRVATARVPAPSDPEVPESDVLYYHRDRAGSVVATTLTGGRIGEKYRYLPYGGIDRVEVVTGNAQSELGYTGALKLTGSLLHLNARVYDTNSARFLQPDVVDALRYTYAAGDPVGLVDPSGLLPRDGGRDYYSEVIPLPGLLEAFLPDAEWYASVSKGVDPRRGNPELWSNMVLFFGGSSTFWTFINSLPVPAKQKVPGVNGGYRVGAECGSAPGRLACQDGASSGVEWGQGISWSAAATAVAFSRRPGWGELFVDSLLRVPEDRARTARALAGSAVRAMAGKGIPIANTSFPTAAGLRELAVTSAAGSADDFVTPFYLTETAKSIGARLVNAGAFGGATYVGGALENAAVEATYRMVAMDVYVVLSRGGTTRANCP